MDLRNKSDKVAVITGASSGIGRACAFRFSDEGYSVALIARRLGELSVVEEEIRARGGKAAVFQADLTDEEQIAATIDEIVAKLGGIDVLVNAAGVIANGTIENTSIEDWDHLMNINLRAPFYMLRCAAPHLSLIHISTRDITSFMATCPPHMH